MSAEDAFDEAAEKVAEQSGRAYASNVSFGSLGEALRARRIPLENHAVIRHIVDVVGIREFIGMSSYIKAVRSDGRAPDLHIHYGYTNGIEDETVVEAIFARLSTADRTASTHYRSVRRRGIGHPANKTRPGGRSARRKPDYGTCPECFTEIFANQTCNCLD